MVFFYWGFLDEDSYVHPENLVTLLTTLNSSIPYMIGSKAYSVFDTEMGKMSSDVPYGPMDGFGYLNNTIVNIKFFNFKVDFSLACKLQKWNNILKKSSFITLR